MKNNLGLKPIVLVVLTASIAASAQAPAAHRGLVHDWSQGHVVFSGGLSQKTFDQAMIEPRLQQIVLQRNLFRLGGNKRIDGSKKQQAGNNLKRDWSASLGNGNIAPFMSPAKFGFDTSGAPSCANDFAVYGLNVAGVTGGQANLVALNNLYAGAAGTAFGIRGSPNGASEAGTTATITTTANHGFYTGETIQVAGVGVAGYNGTFVITVTGARTFTYTAASSGLANSGGGTATPPAGACGANPSFFWSYNGSTGGGSILTSPALSLDGTKVAYVESAAGQAIFHVLTWKSGEGASATVSVVPTLNGACTASSSCLKSLTYSAAATNTNSSPWIDYRFDKAYLGSDDGKVYRISCVFTCALNSNPVVDWTYTLPVAGTGGSVAVPNSPVLDDSTGRLIVGDSLGELWSVNARNASATLAAGPLMVGGGGCTVINPPGRIGTPLPCVASGGAFGIADGVLLDGTSGRLIAFSGNDGNAGASATVVQATTLLASVVRAHIGLGSVANVVTPAVIHAGTFDNNYFGATPATGLLFMCGTDPANSSPYHWNIGFTAYPTMNATATALVSRGFANGDTCTPYTEVYNPNADIDPGTAGVQHDMLLSGVNVAGGTGYVITNNISAGTVASALATATYTTGTSAFIIDNFSASSQASSLYFSTLANDASCGTRRCAVKLTQVGLR